MAVIMAFTLLDLRVGTNLPLVMAFKRVTQGMRMVKCRFDGEWEFSAGRARHAAKEVMTRITLEWTFTKKCVSTIKGKTNKMLRQAESGNNVRGITGFVKMIRKEGCVPATAVCESTANYWIAVHDILEDAGINALLAHPHNTRIITETVYKDDKADSARLADLCRLGMIPESFVADKPARDMRELTRTRLGMKMHAAGPENRIHAILAKYPARAAQGRTVYGTGTRVVAGSAPEGGWPHGAGSGALPTHNINGFGCP